MAPESGRTIMWVAFAAALTAAIAFAAAMVAVPPAGPYCLVDCQRYPYADTLRYFPHDYVWLALAMLMLLAWLVLVAALEGVARVALAARAALLFTLLSAGVLLPTYAVQLFAVPASQLAGEIEGLAFFTMYNGHGVFIALEELGYGLMALSFLALALALPRGGWRIDAARGLFALGFALPLAGLVYYVATYGLTREYRLEVFVIGVTWSVLILASTLLALHFRRV